MGLPSNTAFKIMESVRKGKVAKGKEGKWDEYVALMREHNVPEWYIDSCKKIKYMFPKAHAAAYVTNAFRIAWFKVHEPRAYYAAYYTIRADAFDSDIMCHGVDRVKNKMKEIELAGKSASKKDQDTYQVLEIVLEMYERGLNFDKIDLYESDPIKFKVTKDCLLKPPLNSIPGLGTVAAQAIADGRKDGEFSSKDDLRIRGKVGKATMEILEKAGCLEGMTESNQLSLFA
jgi:DNA polymerase-3 subunit alpha (Gram-positive type)